MHLPLYFSSLTQYEQLRTHQGAGAGVSPMILSSGEGKEVDILRMLTKAKDEYTKVSFSLLDIYLIPTEGIYSLRKT